MSSVLFCAVAYVLNTLFTLIVAVLDEASPKCDRDAVHAYDGPQHYFLGPWSGETY
jgi:hypothetical protein